MEIAGGLIAALHAPGGAPRQSERIDLAGALLLPAFVDGHIHLDKTHWGAPRLPHVEGRGVRERIAAERAQRHRVGLPIEARASALIRTLIANGTTRARSHVDIDNDVGLANLEAVLRVREAYREWIDIQLVAFPQSGVMTEKGAPDLMAAALRAAPIWSAGWIRRASTATSRASSTSSSASLSGSARGSTFICTTAARPARRSFARSPSARSPPACKGA